MVNKPEIAGLATVHATPETIAAAEAISGLSPGSIKQLHATVAVIEGEPPPTFADVQASILQSQQRIAEGEFWNKLDLDAEAPPFEEVRANFERLRDKPDLFAKLFTQQCESVDAQAKHNADVLAKIQAHYESMTPEQRAARDAWEAENRFQHWKAQQPPELLARFLAEATAPKAE